MKAIINKKVRYHYTVLHTIEAGIVLIGSEVKSIKNGHADISNAYVSIRNDEIYLINGNVPRYKHSSPHEEYDTLRDRKLLLHKKDIFILKGKLTQKGLTLVPIKVYTKRGIIKVEVGLVKGKSKVDKRETIKERESKRRMSRILKQNVNN